MAWSEASRAAAAEARKNKGGGYSHLPPLDMSARNKALASGANRPASAGPADPGTKAFLQNTYGGNGAAAAALSSGTPKSDAVPVHSGMNGSISPNDPRVGSREFNAMGHPRDAASISEYDSYNRDLSLRSRNGQVGSGMKFRG